ncbi:DUF1360 domain-containing protein [Actinoallomurus sp. CA-142502]|uniref:DUF1360 domain-containing protein n=1 Tax=Actinoallomurus sp. CA-142502 TaxID=3239885 RepID=UPI003D8F25F0
MNTVTDAVRDQRREYSQGEDRPLGSYAATLAVYGLTAGGAAVAARLTGRRPPDLGLRDVALMAITTHRVSRTLAKDPVTSPLRAPFTRYEGVSGPSELKEEVRGAGVRHAVGELISCPFCMGQWVATAYAAGMVFAPRTTRFAGATITAVAVADWLQLAYAKLQQSAEG